MLGLREIFEAMRTEVNERRLGREIAADENPRRVGDQNLPTMPHGHEPCNTVNSGTEIITAAFIGVSRVHSHAHVNASHAAVIFLRNRALRFNCSGNRIGRAGEGNTESVADRLEDVAAMSFKEGSQERVMTLNGDAHKVAMRFPTLRRAFDIGKQKGHSAGR